ncbi:MAG: DUF4239 domain-containing protein [Myxococcota bacterium]|nr:DUF4239 domain-containing protein [Myxococcota bacterium]
MDPFSAPQKWMNRVVRSRPWVVFTWPLATGVATFAVFPYVATPVRSLYEMGAVVDLAEGIGTFLTVIGVVYALIIGFTFQQCFARQDELRQQLTAEAGSLRNVLLLCDTLKAWTQRQVVAGTLREYTERLLSREFPPEGSLAPDPAATLYQIVPVLNEVSVDGVSDATDRVTLTAIHDELRAATRARSSRLAVAVRHIPRIHWFGIELLSTLILAGYLLLDLGALRLEATLFGMTTAAISVLYISLFDLDYPFGGLWSVEAHALEALRGELAAIEREKPPEAR